MSINGSISLFVRGIGQGNFSSGVPLFVQGSQTGISQLTGGIPLYTYTASGDNRASGQIPLYLAGEGRGSLSGNIPLYVNGVAYELSSYIPLYLRNDQSGINGNIPLYVSGYGIQPGYYSLSSGIPLYLERNTANAIPLFVLGPGTPINSGLNLYTLSNLDSSGNIPMYVSGLGYLPGTLGLYTHGF